MIDCILSFLSVCNILIPYRSKLHVKHLNIMGCHLDLDGNHKSHLIICDQIFNQTCNTIFMCSTKSHANRDKTLPFGICGHICPEVNAYNAGL